MRTIPALGIAALALGLSACGNPTISNAIRIANRNAEASGSPFRWTSQGVGGGTTMRLVMLDLPSSPSRADPVLKKDILKLISSAEAAAGRTNPQVEEEVKRLSDGREVWVLKSAEDGLAYIVTLQPASDGGTDIQLQGPQKYSL